MPVVPRDMTKLPDLYNLLWWMRISRGMYGTDAGRSADGRRVERGIELSAGLVCRLLQCATIVGFFSFSFFLDRDEG